MARRRHVTSCAIYVLMLFWTTVVSFCATATDVISSVFNIDAEGSNLLERIAYQVLPVVLLLSIINLLPLVLQILSEFYERHKAKSQLDVSVVERFFQFQFVNVYVSILATAIISDFKRLWHRPASFISKVGHDTPVAALYFAKVLAVQCGTAPLWVFRAWPLLSRGFKTWTVQPPDLPGMLYGWAYPKATRPRGTLQFCQNGDGTS